MFPYNATNNHVYSARNAEILEQALQRHGWTSPQFAGFHQWKQAGRVVKKGEKGTPVEMFVDKKIETDGGTEKLKVRKVKFVFNIDQTEILSGRSPDAIQSGSQPPAPGISENQRH